MADETIAELNELFNAADKGLEPDIVNILQSIMHLHELSAQDMYYKWESYCIKMDQPDMKLTVTTAHNFKQDLQDALERSVRSHAIHIKSEKKVSATPRAGAKGGDVFGMLDGLVPNTPAGGAKLRSTGKKKQFETPSIARIKKEPASSPDFKSPSAISDHPNSLGAVPPSSFIDRPNPGEVIEVLNDSIPAPEPPICPFGEPRLQLKAASDQKKLAYKPMAMKLSEASEILDERIDNFRDEVQKHHKLDDSVFGSAASASTTPIISVGRIACDSAEGKLNSKSLVLEMSRRQGAGLRIPLDVSKLRNYHFFPGQIVALKGINSTGVEFTVSEVLEIPLLPNAASFRDTLDSYRERLRGGPDAMDDDSDPLPLNIMFASGPYTADDNLDFEPLHALCEKAGDTYADAMILTGPFIDMDHPMIASGDFDLPEDAHIDPDTATMNVVFKYMISPALNRLSSANPAITILLVPSVRDVIDKHVSWPQEGFPRKELGLPKTAKIVGNPMTLHLNEMLLGISSQDILFELKNETLNAGMGDVGRLCKDIIEQRHYFPLFPPTDRNRLPKTAVGSPPGAMLDLGYLGLGEIVKVRPDILVIPSALPPFV